jgi:hypothetical protein
LQVLLLYLPVDKHIDYASTAGAYCSPAGLYKILLSDLTLYDHCLFLLRRRCCGSHSSIAIGQEFLDYVVLFIGGHMADVIAQWAVAADVSGLTTSVA